MRTFQEIKDSYQFSEMESETLRILLPLVEPHADRLISDFYQYFLQIPDAARFLQDEAQRGRLTKAHREWLLALFTGPFDDRYYQRLQRIGYTHVHIGLSAHFVYAGVNFLRLALQRLIDTEVEPRLRESCQRAMAKSLDLNLDIIARTYHEAEMRRVFLSYRLDNALIRFAHRFTFGLNMLLLVGLIALSLGVVAVLVHDISLIFRGNPEKGLVSALGSLLVLWLMIELLDAEIERLQGGAFQLSLFVGVALVAFIRKVLVASLAHEDLKTEVMYMAGILILGAIFWLVSRTEKRKG